MDVPSLRQLGLMETELFVASANPVLARRVSSVDAAGRREYILWHCPGWTTMSGQLAAGTPCLTVFPLVFGLGITLVVLGLGTEILG
jgi:hypothetical protein